MSRLSVDEIQSRVAAVVDQDQDTTNISSTDYSLRLTYINSGLHRWAEIYPWQVLYGEYNMLVSTSTGNASIVLPVNFRKLASYPKITYDGVSTEEFPEVLPQEDGQYTDTDKRVWLMGNPAGGYILRVLGTTLVSGASVKIPYLQSPASLASPANIPEIPDAEYLVQHTVATIWETQGDERFPQARAESNRLLSNMIEYENVHNYASTYNRVKTVEERKHGFRLGRD